MISKELIKKIRYIQIYTSKAVNDVLAGEYHSVFKGQGMEFDEVRAYQPGDDIRTIDWNVTARTGHPYVKRYVEEREITVFFLVDLSKSGSFGSREKLKNEVAAEGYDYLRTGLELLVSSTIFQEIVGRYRNKRFRQW